MTTAELWVHYHMNPPPKRKALEPEINTPIVAVLPYHKWIRNKCASCGHHGASGLWLATFNDDSQYHIMLCATCGLQSKHISKACGIPKLYPGGFGAPGFVALDLLITFTFQSRTPTPEKKDAN